jgi:hypothetical protein
MCDSTKIKVRRSRLPHRVIYHPPQSPLSACPGDRAGKICAQGMFDIFGILALVSLQAAWTARSGTLLAAFCAQHEIAGCLAALAGKRLSCCGNSTTKTYVCVVVLPKAIAVTGPGTADMEAREKP